MLMGYVKIVICVLSTGEGVGAAGMLAQKLAVLVLFGILLSAQKQHVLTEVGQS